MSLGGSLYALLKADPTLDILLTAVDASDPRIYPNLLRQGAALPAVVYTIISDVPMNTVDGAKASLRRARVQVDCYSFRVDEADVIADAVEGVLGFTQRGFTSVLLVRENSYEDVSLYHRVRMDFSVWRNP